LSSSFFDEQDIEPVEAKAPQESFFDQDDIEATPIGGEFSDIVSEEMQAQPPEDSVPKLPEVSQPEAALEGAKQGVTMGFADEAGAGVQSSMDKMQRLLNEYTGLVGKSPTQVSEQLASEGFTGDLGPTSSEELYEEAVGEERKKLQAAEEQHPGTTMTADIAAGMLLPIPGAKLASKALPNAIEGIKGASKIKKGLAAGAITGAGEAAGRTEEDLLSSEGLTDVATGAALGGSLGAIGGKVSEKFEADKLAKKAKGLLEEAEDTSLRAAGISNKEMSDQIEKQVRTDKISGAGITGLEEGIVDPLLKPKGAYKKAIDVKNQISEGYENLTNRFSGRSSLSEQQAQILAQKQGDEILETVQDALSKTDDITESAEAKVHKDLETLKEELAFAYQSDNPIRELQEMYVKHNDKFFSNASSGSAMARKTLRTKLKEIQRNYAKALDPESFDEFAELDKKFTDILDLEQITKRTAGQERKAGGISDISRGITAEMVTKIPGISAPVTAASIASKKFLDKDITKFAEGLKAQRLFKKSKKLQEAASDPSKLRQAVSSNPVETAVASVTGATGLASGMTKDEPVVDSYKLHRKTARMAERATPEMLTHQAQSIREAHGQEGEVLATTLEKMADRDVSGRRALMFHLLQNPRNKKMLMPEESNDE